MAKNSERFIPFLDYLMQQPRTMDDLKKHFNNVSKRTIQRWIKNLETEYKEYNIKITHNKSIYRLTDDSIDEIKNNTTINWMFNTRSLTSIIQNKKALKHRIGVEDIPSSDSRLQRIFEAMEANRQIEFTYTKYNYNHERIQQRYVMMEPYGVKLFERRWYVICHTPEDKIHKYSIDQIKDLEVKDTTFELPPDFSITNFFKDVYGIITDLNDDFQTIEIRVDEERANYFKYLPLHDSQKVLVDIEDPGYVHFTYKLRPANDFYQALLHHGPHVEVLKPESAREKIKGLIQEMAKKYGIKVK